MPIPNTMFNESAYNVTQYARCPGKAVTLFLTLFTFVVGIIGNVAVISFIRHQRSIKNSCQLTLLYNMSVNNVLALCTSLTLHLALNEFNPWETLPLKLANILCALKPISEYIYLKVGLLTLAGICIDRYEIFVRMTQNKYLTKERAKILVVITWIVAIVTTGIACYGYIQNALRPHVYCDHSPRFVYGLTTKHSLISEKLVIADNAVWILICNTVNIFSPSCVGRMLTKHMEGVKSTLGSRKALREVKMVKMAAYVFLAYVVFWLPYGIVALIKISSEYPSRSVSCFYSLCQTLSFAIFAAIPFIYIGTNKRVLRETIQSLRRPVGRLASVSAVKIVEIRPRRKTVGAEYSSNDGKPNLK